MTFTVDVPAEWEPVPSTHSATRLVTVRGLVGEHCEFDLHIERRTPCSSSLVLAWALTSRPRVVRIAELNWRKPV